MDQKNRIVTLPSGAKLEVQVAPFTLSKSLYMAVAEEAKALKLDPGAEVDVNFFKDIFCTGIASKKIEMALAECMKRATYNGLKITDDTWEPLEARQDYLPACFEVAQENIKPFMKSLYAQFAESLTAMKKALA